MKITTKTKKRYENVGDNIRIGGNMVQYSFSDIRDFLEQVKTLSIKLSGASSGVTEASEIFINTTHNIADAMNEVDQGITQQAGDAEKCLIQMDDLSNKIVLVSNNTKEINILANAAKKNIVEGTIITDDLNSQTESTLKITRDIISEIENLSEKSQAVNKVVNVINEIANQTNLLSLNASIEAARAGEYGKGFAVVTGEIRKLAELSKESVKDIKNIIESIQNDITKTADKAKKAEKVIYLQDIAVKNTTVSYHNIDASVEKLVNNIQYISADVDNIEKLRVNTLGAIESISAVLEEIAASSNSVTQISNEQLNAVVSLITSSGILNENIDELVNSVHNFKL
jgi:methyl-accepting chemotaxis protein